VWINNIIKSLYLVILTRILIAAIICVTLLATLVLGIDFAVSYRNNIYMERQSSRLSIMVQEIQDKITANHWTLSQAKNEDFTDIYPDYYILFFSKETYQVFYKDIEQYPLEFFKKSLSHNTKFSDVDGTTIIVLKDSKIVYRTYLAIACVITFVIFFSISMRLIKPIISYIEKIEKGINVIAQEDMCYKIPVIGRNELSRLAVNINHMGSLLYEKQEKDKRTELSKKILITNMSHDLRTPLTSVLGYIGLIKENMPPSDKNYEYVQIAEKNSLRLEKLIDDLFMYSKLLSNDLVLNMLKVEVNVILHQIIELKKYYVHFEAHPDKIYINVDINQFQRAFDNLLDNAEKYRSADSEIYLKILKAEDSVLITISNKTAINLSGKIEFLTKRLYTVDMDKKTDSNGLGLSIVNELMKHMDGTLEIEYEDYTFTSKLIFPSNNADYKS
jgi:signal transduction histidine kinase